MAALDDRLNGPKPLAAGWDPRTEEELERCAQNGLLEETHWLDLKRELEPGTSANKKLACDIAAFALDGGPILLGVDADTSPPRLWPIPVAGLAERIEQIAQTRVEEAVQVRIVVIESMTQPGHGYLVVHVPVSVRAPHMADGRYYGRGDKTNRVLPNVEVVRLLDRRLSDRKDLRTEARTIRNNLVGDRPLFVAVADPGGAHDELLVPLSESHQWQQTVLELVHAAIGDENRRYAPTLADASGFARRPGGVAATTGMFNGARFEDKDYAAEVTFTEAGRLVLASERAVTTWSFPHVSPQPPDVLVVFESLILGNLSFLVRLAAEVSRRFGFTGSWRFALSINGLDGSSSLAVQDRRFGDRGTVYTEDIYERATEASLIDIDENPGQVVAALVAPLLRSLDSSKHFSGY